MDFRKKTDQYEVYFDNDTNTVHVIYQGTITPEITAEVYQWGFEIASSVGAENIRAMITDFRNVEKFDFKNLKIASKESRSINQKFDLTHIPVALVVSNMYQEQMVTVSMRLTQQEERMRLVNTEKEARVFIDAFHQKRATPNKTTDDDETPTASN